MTPGRCSRGGDLMSHPLYRISQGDDKDQDESEGEPLKGGGLHGDETAAAAEEEDTEPQDLPDPGLGAGGSKLELIVAV